VSKVRGAKKMKFQFEISKLIEKLELFRKS